MSTQKTMFARGYDDADKRTASVLRQKGEQNATVDIIEREAIQCADILIANSEYAAGKLRCWRDAELMVAKDMGTRTARKLREIADIIEGK